MKKRIDIGNADFFELIRDDAYFIDKSLIVRDVIESPKITLIPRPRRFGKTLNMSILKYYFDIHNADEYKNLFDGLKILDTEEKYTNHQGQHPVISLSMKDLQGKNWEDVYSNISSYLATVFIKYKYLIDSLTEKQQKLFNQIIEEEAKESDLNTSLNFLIQALYQYHGKSVVILIDEYDSLILDGYADGYYKEVINFLRPWFGSALKNKESQSIFKAVLTGIMRVARESIFSDMNNLKVDSVLVDSPFADKFGFTENEVKELLKNYDKSLLFKDVEEWYNGYTYGEHTIYNPWSLMNFVDSNTKFPRSYWKNTSSNKLVHDELLTGDQRLREDLEKLIRGEKLISPINDNIVFSDIGQGNTTNIWSFLFYAGYLKVENPMSDPSNQKNILYEISSPNYEVDSVYEDFIYRFFQGSRRSADLARFLSCFTEDKYILLEDCLQDLVLGLVSFHDANKKMPEVVFHAFILGLLANVKDAYEIRSNAETGYGRADIMLLPKIPMLKTAFVMEFKSIKHKLKFDAQLNKALKQIENNEYHQAIKNAGFADENIVKVAIVLKGKKIKVKIPGVEQI